MEEKRGGMEEIVEDEKSLGFERGWRERRRVGRRFMMETLSLRPKW